MAPLFLGTCLYSDFTGYKWDANWVLMGRCEDPTMTLVNKFRVAQPKLAVQWAC